MPLFLARRPSAMDVQRLIDRSRDRRLTYEPQGLSSLERPRGFTADERVALVGKGHAAFARAKDALAAWRHFETEWVELLPGGASTTPGTVVVIAVKHLGFWSLNPCRLLPSRSASPHVFELVYGTLPEHTGSGEELFRVSYDPQTTEVRYTIRAVFKPQSRLAWLGYPYTRYLQSRFRLDSTLALARAIGR